MSEKRSCAKCGGGDLHIRYVEPGDEFEFGRNRVRPLPAGFEYVETWSRRARALYPLLMLHCRTCQWDWSDLPNDASPTEQQAVEIPGPHGEPRT